MAETDPGMSTDHVVVDVEAAAAAAAEDADSSSAAAAAANTTWSCAVCMEPMEWVAVSPCGHRDVCVRCAARIRFVHNDRRCCICRTHCATVVVTRAITATTTTQGGGGGGGGFPFLWPPAPAPAFGGQGLVGAYYWYHRGMGAYFDDMSQYKEMSKLCSTSSPPASTSGSSRESGGAGVGVNQKEQPAASMNLVDLNVVSVPSARQADDDASLESEVERPLSRQEKAQLVLLGVLGAFVLGAPLLYMIPT